MYRSRSSGLARKFAITRATCSSTDAGRGGSNPRRPSSSRSASVNADPLLRCGSCSRSIPRGKSTSRVRALMVRLLNGHPPSLCGGLRLAQIRPPHSLASADVTPHLSISGTSPAFILWSDYRPPASPLHFTSPREQPALSSAAMFALKPFYQNANKSKESS